MTSHSHSFQCFDAVVEKPSLTAGHNFASTNSSTCSKTHLEQLENCRCSLCSESQQAKPMTSVVSGNQPASWYQPQSPSHQHTHRRSMPPEGNPVYGAAHHHYNHHQYHTHRHRKRIVLVKNSNPSIQKTILLHRKPVHSLCVFMDDVSELMQCLIRKLYTLDGHRVDNIQSLLQGPSILVCVGHEPFHPLLLDSFQNNSEVKLPKLILKARSSTCNEDQGYKKNVNFGLKSKKSISPGHFPEARENMLDDDIEKRVLVNKDGSLSMEMKVRFRLLNDETLHCSTEIKKSSCTFNVSFPEQDNVDYPQCGHSESCSEAESLSASEAEDVYIPRLCQKHLQEPHSQHCCTHCQEYDIWKNPTLRKQETLRHFGSTNFNASSHKVKCKTESFDRMNTTSCEEYTEQVVEKATCIEHTVGERDKGDNTVQYCTISRCSSHSEVRSSKNLKQDQMSVQITKVSIEDERPLSVETNSSDILASLKEDKDKEEPDLTPYNSRASQNNKSKAKQIQNAEENSCTFTPCKPPESPNHSISMRSSSIASSCSVKSKTSGKVVVTKIQKNVNQDGNNTPSSTPHTCENKDPAIGNGTSAEKLEATNQAEDVLDENEVVEIDMRVLKSESDLSKTCGHISDDTLETFKRNEKGRSSVRSTPSNSNTDLSISNSHVVAEQESVNVGDASEEENIEVISHAMSADTDTSESPIPNNKTEGTGDEKVASVMTTKSNVSTRSNQSSLSEVKCKERKKAELQKEERAQRVISVHSNASTISKQSAVSDLLANGTEGQTEEVLPHAMTNVSRSSQISDLETSELREIKDQIEKRSPSIMSIQCGIFEASPVKLVKSAESRTTALSTKTNISVRSMTSKISEGKSNINNRLLMDRVPSAMSGKSDISVSSKTSNICHKDSDVVEEAREHQTPSAKSNQSNNSSRSNTPKISTAAPKDILEEERLKRPPSVMSSKSSVFVRSTKSKLSDENNYNTTEKTEQLEDKYTSVMSYKPRDSETSMKFKTSDSMLENSVDFEYNSEEQAPNTVSTKANTTRRSKKSEMLETSMGGKEERPLSATSLKPSVSGKSEKCKISEAAQDCNHPDERLSSIISSTSVKSKKSVFSDAPCENQQEETKQTGKSSQNALSVRSHRSKKPKSSEASRQDIGDEDNRERTSNTMSCKSSLSDRSNLARDGVDNTESTEDLLMETETNKETKDDRAASALSSKSQMSILSNKSKYLSQGRAPTSKTSKCNVSAVLKKDESASVLASPTSNTSAIDLIKPESSAVVSSAEGEQQSTDRTLSAMSENSKRSKKSKENIVSGSFKEPEDANKEALVKRSPSAVSEKSNTSVISKGSDTQSMGKIGLRSISPKSSTSAKNEKSNCSIISSNSPNVDAGTWDIKIEKRAQSDMSSKSCVSSRSVKSISALAGGQTDIVCLNERSDSAVSGLKISITEFSNNSDTEERASSTLSTKSNSNSVHHMSERVLTPASASVSIGIVEEYNVDSAEEDNSVSKASVNSTAQLNSKTDVCCKESSKTIDSENQQHWLTPDNRGKSSLTQGTIISDKSKKSEGTHKNSCQPIIGNEVAKYTTAIKNSKKSSGHSLSSRSAHTDTGSSKTKDTNPDVFDKPNSKMSNSLVHLEVNGQKSNVNAKSKSVSEWSRSNLSNDRHAKKEGKILRPHSTDMPISSVLRQKSKELDFSLGVSNHRSSPSNKNANKVNTTGDLNICARTCNGSVVATDCSMNVIDNKSEKNSTSSCRHSSSSFSELVSSVLPKSSPTEVVNEWLKKIPIESALYDVWDDFQKNCEEEVVLKMTGEVMKYERRNGREGDADVAVPKPENEQLPLGKIENNESKVGDMKETTKENIQPCTFPDVPSCVQLMRILLSPKLERCNSLPEVSPVYARKLSMSARGFLDSLVNLHLLDFNPNDVNGKDEKYSNLMKMLQTLCDPPDSMTIPQKNAFNNQQSNDEEYNFRSSSGEDINSSSQVSEKSSDNVSTLTLKSQSNTERQGMLTNVQEIDQTEERIERISNSATPDIASRVRWTPENDVEENIQESNLLLAVQENDSNVNQKLTDHKEDTCSGSPSSGQILTEKVSQDPYPVWVLNLLNSVEKEFMTHYVNAMVEFKVRWNLNNNEQLDVMICELRDEVHKRIQVSINNELRKIQGHVGKPRPPKESMSRESSILSEQRRRRLKVNLNQSTESAARTGDDDGNTKLMTEFSDQQNDDEYCPCDTCMKKKMLLRPVFPTEVRNSAPLMTDFDLRKILNLKRNPLSNSTVNVNETENMEQHTEDGNVAEDVWLQSFMKEKTQPGFTEQKQNKSDTINYKCLGKEYSQVVVGSKPQEVRKGGSWSSPEDDVSDTQPNKLKKLQSNNTSRALEQESPSASGEHLEIASADSTAEEENAQSGPADMGGDDKITEDEEEVCNNPIERKGSMEGETVREKHSIQAGTARENLKVETGTVGEQEAADRESTDGKGTEDNETVDETAEDKTESVGERASKENQAAEGEISEPELVKKGEIPDDAKEMKENAKNESTWKESEGSDIAVEAEKIVSTNNEKTDANKSAEEDIKKISKEGGEDDLLEEEKISEPAEDGYITEHESAEGAYPMNDESENEEETDNDEIDAEVKTTKAETVADEEPADAETNKAQTDDTADDVTENEETPTAKFAEDREITNDKIADDEGADTGNKVISETPCNETVDETKFKTTEYEEMHDDRISDDGEAVVVAEDEETAETAEKNRNDDDDDDIDNDNVDDNDDDNDDDDERSEKPEIIDNEIVAIDAKDSETPNDNKADCEITEDEETPNDNATNGETAEESETPNDDKADDGTAEDEEKPNDNTVDDGTAEDSETPNDNTIDDGTAEDSETPNDNTIDDGTAEDSETPNDNTIDDGTAEDSETPNDNTIDDGTAEDSETPNDNTIDDGTAEDSETPKDNTVDDGTAEDSETPNDNTVDDGTAEDSETPNDNTVDDGTAEDSETPNDNTVDDGTAEDSETPNDNTVDDGTAEDSETPNDNRAIVGKAEESDLEEVDETTGAETAEDGEQEDDGRANGQIGDDKITDDETTTGTEDEENKETAEAKTGENKETADNGTTEDRDTADASETDDEELSEHEIAHNREIVDCSQSDDSESLENGETAEEVNGETHKINTVEAVINTHNMKKANSNMLSIYVSNPRESDEGGDEAEDETEPVGETEGSAYGIKCPAMQPMKFSLHKADIKINSTVKVYPSSEDGADADAEDSDTEVYNLDGCVENEVED